MSAKEPTQIHNQAVRRQQPLHPVSPEPEQLTQQPDPTALIQRARQDPTSLTTRDVKKLQRTIGNHSVQRMLAESHARPRPVSLAGLVKHANQKGIGEEDEEVPARKEAVTGAATHIPAQEILPEAREVGEPWPAALADQEKIAGQKGIGDEDEEVPARKEAAVKSAQPLTAPAQRYAETSLTVSPTDLAIHPERTRTTGFPLLQRQPAPPPPTPPATPAPAGRAGLNYLPTLMDQTPSGWGVTTEDDAVIDITAYSDGAAWKCVITKADQQAHQGVRLLPGVVELTGGLVAGESDCAILTTMAKSLKDVADQGSHSGYYMLSAVQAHENLHITQYRTALNPHFTTLKTAVEALTVPFAGNADAAAAKAAIKALPGYTAANATFHTADVAANNATASHSPMAPFITVEHGVVDPMITTINARKTTLKCAP